jgi:glycosyltransferase involved in cell wall biosynthesis
MKIAMVVVSAPPQIGGMGQVAYNEAAALAGNGHQVTLFALRYPRFKYQDSNLPFKVVRLRPLIKIGDAGVVPQLLWNLKGFDLIHLHYPFYGAGPWIWMAAIFSKSKFVVTYHMDARPKGIYKKFLRWLYDVQEGILIMGLAKRIIIVDKEYFNKVRFAKLIDKKKVIELANPINNRMFGPTNNSLRTGILQKWQDKKIILFVGNLMPVKRLDLLIDAFSKLSNTEARLLVVGAGYSESKYKKQVEFLRLRPRVEFVGAVKQSKLETYYNAAWCTVVPSDFESFSLVALESMACATPVLASNTPGLKSKITLGQNGFLFTPGSQESLTQKLSEVLSLSAPRMEQVGERAEQYAKGFNINKHTQKLERIYKELIFL